MSAAASLVPGMRSLLLLFLLGVAPAFPAPAGEPASRDALARAQYERAKTLRAGLEQKPASERRAREYLRAVRAYRRVYLITPQSTAATPAVMAIGELYEEMGQRFDSKYFQSAVDAYQYLLHQYPRSRYAAQALLAVGRLEREELNHPELARRTYEEFLRRFPDSPEADQARQALEENAGPEATPASPPPAPPEETADEAAGEPVGVSAIHYQSSPQGTLVTLMTAGAVQYRSGQARNPDRIYFDLYPARLAPTLREKTLAIDDGVVKEIRVGQHTASVVRVVLEPENVASYSAFLLNEPYRLVINLQTAKGAKTERTAARDSARGAAEGSEAAPRPKPSPPVVPPPTRHSQRSLTRTLGLKIGRIVIDPGHGGFDTGTIGPTGLAEKTVCLDVALRLGKLIERRLTGMQVIYTRHDDRFIPLETRTALANQNKADLFISIHANSSRNERARGIETYYLNFTTSPDALEVATRENALSNRSIHDLQDLLKKIARNDKIEESRELATDIQASLVSRLRRTRLGDESRGVKKAPFVVLIGAHMPSVLVEISFLSNRADERLLRGPFERQRVAEALFRGIAKYLASLNSLPGTQLARYRVQRGDTLWSIARAHHTTIAALRATNPRVAYRTLRPGDRLLMPVAAGAESPERQAELATHGSGK